MSDIVDFGAADLSTQIHAKTISCRELMQATLKQIEKINPIHNAIVSLRDSAQLLADADAHDAMLSRGESKGWMHGLPQAIKDLSPAEGLPLTMGSPLLRSNIATHDGLMVQRMKAAGAIVIGKTNTPEFGLGSHTFNEVFGATKNAFDITKTAGGSSGGAAVALATKMLSVADGSDFMGSLRNPAAWNNIYGMRPSNGRVPTWPAADAFVSQLGTEGPMGRNVRDVALLLQTQAGFDARTPLAISQPFVWPDVWPDVSETSSQSLLKKAPRIGWLGDLNGYLAVEPGINDLCEQALKRLTSAGCNVESISLGYPPEKVWQAWLIWRAVLVASRLAPFAANADNLALMKPEALWECESGRHVSGAQFMQASVDRTHFYHHMASLFETYDYLALPSAQVWPFSVQERWPKTINGRAMDTYHRWMEAVIYATFAGLPCISVPVGFRALNPGATPLPMGMQIIGRPQADLSVLQLAALYEAL